MKFPKMPWDKTDKEKIVDAELRQRRREIVEVMQENVKLRKRIEELELKHISWEDYKLSRDLRHFADRALVCWEGNDADEAIEAMINAADLLRAHLLDGDQYNNNNMEDM